MEFNIFGIKINIKRELAVIMAVFLIVIIGLIGFIIARSDKGIIIETRAEYSDTGETSLPLNPENGAGEQNENNKQEEEIKVYVVGCVKQPGIVTLKKGQLIDDAIKAAGGATDEADMDNINLVYALRENVMLRIYSKEESHLRKGTGEAGSAVDIIRDGGEAVSIRNGDEKGPGAKININTASAGELDTLPGIGEATANDIIAYRKKHGPFKKIEDIMNVPGIKQSRFNNIKEYITVD